MTGRQSDSYGRSVDVGLRLYTHFQEPGRSGRVDGRLLVIKGINYKSSRPLSRSTSDRVKYWVL